MKIFVFVTTLSVCAFTYGQSLQPSQRFPFERLMVQAPNEVGWKIAKSQATIAFKKEGEATDRGYGAQVFLFPLPPTKTPEEFLVLVKDALKKDKSQDQFRIEMERVQITNERRYLCIRHEGAVEDRLAAKDQKTGQHLKLHVRSLYCRHPEKRDIGFLVTYTFKGMDLAQNFETMAQSFIDGVYVPTR